MVWIWVCHVETVRTDHWVPMVWIWVRCVEIVWTDHRVHMVVDMGMPERLYIRHVEAVYGYGYGYAMWRLYIRHVEAVYGNGKEPFVMCMHHYMYV